MDVWEKYSLREEQIQHRNRRRESNPSFSSTLLDAIYRSIDESNGKGEHHDDDDDQELILYRETMMRKKKHSNEGEQEELARMQRACMIERWMEKKVSCEKVVVRRKSMADFERKPRNVDRHHQFDSVLLNSSSSSSESSCGGAFSSSESDSFHGAKSRSNSSSSSSMPRPKPIRTSISSSTRPERYERSSKGETDSTYHNFVSSQKPKHEGGFGKTKSKALKIYSDLKKVKQPISPGGRLANFLNSLFTAGNAKKAKISSLSSSISMGEPAESSTCSTASSFSRSCLSKTPSSSRAKLGNNNNGTKRSVRFYPVSVIVDEDCRPCGHKNLYEKEQNYTTNSVEQLHQYQVMHESQRVQEAARELLKNYQKKEEFDQIREIVCNVDNRESYEDDEEEDEDDGASCASSDLFELDNLSAIGIERYREELPVYETTHLGTNRAIANGLIL